jgi:hypothetical protein
LSLERDCINTKENIVHRVFQQINLRYLIFLKYKKHQIENNIEERYSQSLRSNQEPASIWVTWMVMVAGLYFTGLTIGDALSSVFLPFLSLRFGNNIIFRTPITAVAVLFLLAEACILHLGISAGAAEFAALLTKILGLDGGGQGKEGKDAEEKGLLEGLHGIMMMILYSAGEGVCWQLGFG